MRSKHMVMGLMTATALLLRVLVLPTLLLTAAVVVVVVVDAKVDLDDEEKTEGASGGFCCRGGSGGAAQKLSSSKPSTAVLSLISFPCSKSTKASASLGCVVSGFVCSSSNDTMRAIGGLVVVVVERA